MRNSGLEEESRIEVAFVWDSLISVVWSQTCSNVSHPREAVEAVMPFYLHSPSYPPRQAPEPHPLAA